MSILDVDIKRITYQDVVSVLDNLERLPTDVSKEKISLMNTIANAMLGLGATTLDELEQEEDEPDLGDSYPRIVLQAVAKFVAENKIEMRSAA